MARANIISCIQETFTEKLGYPAILYLTNIISMRPIITLSGDQLTGKSTMSKKLAEHYKGEHFSVGHIFRYVAKQQALSLTEQSQYLDTGNNDLDVRMDYRTCELIGGLTEIVEDKSAYIIEGRLPAHMAIFMNSFYKTNVIKIYLKCSYREQAARFLLREVSENAFNTAVKLLPEKEYTSLESVVNDIKQLPISNIEMISKKFIENANRDKADRQRLQNVYGFDFKLAVDIYDIILDVSGKTADQNFSAITEKLQPYKFLKPNIIIPNKYLQAMKIHLAIE